MTSERKFRATVTITFDVEVDTDDYPEADEDDLTDLAREQAEQWVTVPVGGEIESVDIEDAD